ncbi:site-specific DNA-methyltransferase [Flavobacterium sp. WW92]|uniref:DNA methyltransferase n=1 Tax=unclassified Flavobacterium TaxID=196869 RepID=UPI00222570F6|nr:MULTISPECIES: DNA methyltransferase [unclassified Flavobacterium]WDO13073.1 site-specific DNA-methyltransferase [Flavobacterium sp. WW92]
MCGSSTVFNLDCMEVMRNYPDNHFDIAIVDPPYGINAPNMNMGTHLTRKGDGYPGESVAMKLKKGRLNSRGGKLKNRNLNTSIIHWDYEKPGREYFDELFRVSKHQIIWGGNYFDLPPTRCIICWDKLQPWDNFSQWEMAWTSFDKPAKMYRISNTGGGNKEKKIHPTQKPVELYDKIYNDFVAEGMKVLDTHLGSGSHRITAFKFGTIEFTACEIDGSYFADEQERFENFKKQLRLFI